VARPAQGWGCCIGKTAADACCCAGDDPERAAEVCGAWLVLAQVAALDASAPSWEFLQVPDNSLSQSAPCPSIFHLSGLRLTMPAMLGLRCGNCRHMGFL
jgi:hypothetical protein